MARTISLPAENPPDPWWLSVYKSKLHDTRSASSVGALDDLRTGGFRAYEKAHRQRLTEMFLPKFPSLPAEIVSHIVSFGFNCGCYEFDAAPVIEPVAHRTRSKGG